jgi:phosphoglycolate phosphatase-like HAD superfamily hydrolase
MMIKAIIFDCFGVLVSDSLLSITSKIEDQEKKAKIKAVTHKSNRGLLERSESRQQTADILEIEVEEYNKLLADAEVKTSSL